MIQDIQTVLLGIIISVLGAIGPALDAMAYSKGEEKWVLAGKNLARRLNKGILRARDSEPSTPVFKVVFDTLEELLNWVFGPRVASLRFIFFTAVGSTLCFWAYLSLIILTGMQDSTLVQRMFESPRSIITFFILSTFSLITNVLTIAQTRLFLGFFRANPTGLNFLVLAYSDLMLKGTLYVLVFSLGIAFSTVAIDATIEKAIPVAVYWRPDYSPPSPRASGELDESVKEFCIAWVEVKDPRYSDYHRPIIESTSTRHIHCRWDTDADSADEFIQKHFAGLRVIEFQNVSEVRHWPVGCGEGSKIACLHDYTYMVYVHPFLSIYDFPILWWLNMGIAASSMILVAVPRFVLFIDLNQLYSFLMCPWLFGREDNSVCSLVFSLITKTNPKINALVPLTPFFVSTLFLSLAIYLSAFALKFLTVLGEGLRKLLKAKNLQVISEKLLYTQIELVILVSSIVLISTIYRALK